MSADEQKQEQQTQDQQSQTSEAPADAAVEVEADAAATNPLEEEVARLKAESEQLKDQLMRALAEVQNVRRRADMDVEKAHKFGVEKLVKELLPVVDSLEKTVESSQGEGAEKLVSIREGAEMTLSLLLDSLRRFNVEPVDPLGAPFDPQLHEAMSMVEQPTAEPNSVIHVIQKGYTLHGRLLRPAMVVVAKGGVGSKVDTQA